MYIKEQLRLTGIIFSLLFCFVAAAWGQTTMGPFDVTTTSETPPKYDEGSKTLTFTTAGEYKVTQKDPTTPTEVRMVVTAKSGEVTIHLNGVNIQAFGSVPAFDCGTGANVFLVLEDGTENTFKGGGTEWYCYPGIQKVDSDNHLTIQGHGFLNVEGYDSSAKGPGIGMMNQDDRGSNIFIKEVRLSLEGGNRDSWGIAAVSSTISGGTIVSDGTLDEQITITGGSVNGGFSDAKNGSKVSVYKTAVRLNGISSVTKVTSLTIAQDGEGNYTYGSTDMYTDKKGWLYLWLPEGTYNIELTAGETTYHNSIVRVRTDVENRYTLVAEGTYSLSFPSKCPLISSIRVDKEVPTVGETVTLTVEAVAKGCSFSVTGVDGLSCSSTDGKTYIYTFTMPKKDVGLDISDVKFYNIETSNGAYEQTESTLKLTQAGTYAISNSVSDMACGMPIQVTASGEVTVRLNGVNIQAPGSVPAFDCGADANVVLVLEDGAENTFEGGGTDSNRYPGIQKRSSDNFLTIKGSGSLKAIGCSTYGNRYASPGIGGGADDTSTNNIKIERGRLSLEGGDAWGGTHAPGLIADNAIISGGTIVSNNTLYKPITITGGSVNGGFSNAKNNSGVSVYKTRLKLNGISSATQITSLTISKDGQNYDYGITDMYTDNGGWLYLWLPEGTYNIELTAGETTYHNSIVRVRTDVENRYTLVAEGTYSLSFPFKCPLISSVRVDKEVPTVGETVTLTVEAVAKGCSFSVTGVDEVSCTSINGATYTYTFTMPDKDVGLDISDAKFYNIETSGGGVYEQTNNSLNLTQAGTYTISNAVQDIACGMRIVVTASSGDVTVHLNGVNIGGTDNAVPAFDCGTKANVVLELEDGTENILNGGGHDSDWSRYPGIQKGSSDNFLTIRGSGSLMAIGRYAHMSRDASPGIGGGANNASTKNIKIEGGRLSLEGGYANAGVGGTPAPGLIADNAIISGGTIFSNNTLNKLITITGGSVNGGFSDAVNGLNVSVYKTAVRLNGISSVTKVASLTIAQDGEGDYTYGSTDMYTDEKGWLYLWLPEGTYNITANGFSGNVTTTTAGNASVSLYRKIDISSSVSYSAEAHKGALVTVKSTGTFTIDADGASVGELIVEPGGTLITTKALTIQDGFTWQRVLNNKWIPFCTPVTFTTTSPAIATSADDNNKLWLKSGYTQDKQRWELATSMSAGTPYLLAADADNTTATFTATGEVTLPAAGSPTIPEDLPVPDNVLLFCANPSLTEQSMRNIYVIDVASQQVVLKEEDYSLQPFEAYFIASARTQNSLKSFSLRDETPTGVKEVLDNRFRAFAEGRTLVVSNEGTPGEMAVYDLSGRCLFHVPSFAGEKRLTGLQRGTYIVRYGRTAIKVIL